MQKISITCSSITPTPSVVNTDSLSSSSGESKQLVAIDEAVAADKPTVVTKPGDISEIKDEEGREKVSDRTCRKKDVSSLSYKTIST